jgi:hypothetical protein
MLTSETELLDQASNPNTPIGELLSLLVDFPGEVLRNPAFQMGVVADPSLLQGIDLPQQAILALDAEYREIGLANAPAEIRGFVEFCDHQHGAKYRFSPSTQPRTLEYRPVTASAQAAPPSDLVSAIRFASALAPAFMKATETKVFEVYARHPADVEYYIEGNINSDAPGKTNIPLPKDVCAVFRWLLRHYSGFDITVRNYGHDVTASLSERAYYIDLLLVKHVSSKNISKCFTVDGHPAACEDPIRLIEAIQSLEKVVPRRDRDEIVLVIDDTHGLQLDIGINVISLSVEDAIGDGSLKDFRQVLTYALEDLCDQFGLEDAERIDVSNGDESDEDLGGCGVISSALDQLHVFADPSFKDNWSDEFDYRIAAFRNGKLIAFYGDKFEVEKKIAEACLRTEHQHAS